MYLSLSDRPAPTGTQPAPTGRPPRVARLVVTLGIVSLLTDISSESVTAILPLYLTTVVGLSPVAYGFIDGLYQGVSALVRIAAGWAADRWNRPMPVALAGYALSMVSRVLLLFAGGFGTISATISADRIGKGIRTAPRDAMIAASTPRERLGRAFGVHRTLDTIGAAIGPLLAFAVLWQIPDGYHSVMVLSLGFAVLGVAVLAMFVPWASGARGRGLDGLDRRQLDRRARGLDGLDRRGLARGLDGLDRRGGLDGLDRRRLDRRGRARGLDKLDRRRRRWREVATPGLLRTVAVAGVLGLLTVGDGFIYLALLDHGGFAARWFPVLFVGTNLAYLSLAVPLGRLADRVGRIRVLVLGHLPLAGAYLCASAGSGGIAATAAAVLLLGVFYAATDGVLAAVSGQLVPEHVRTSGIATAQTAVAVARLLASTGFGVLWYTMGPRDAMLCVCLALLTVIPVGFTVLRGVGAKA